MYSIIIAHQQQANSGNYLALNAQFKQAYDSYLRHLRLILCVYIHLPLFLFLLLFIIHHQHSHSIIITHHLSIIYILSIFYYHFLPIIGFANAYSLFISGIQQLSNFALFCPNQHPLLFTLQLYTPIVLTLFKLMQLNQPIYQVTSEQVVARDVAELYIHIQQNTEFLTNIIRHQSGRVFKPFNIDIPNVDLKSFFNLIVQSSYLLYKCSIKPAAVFFSKSLYIAYQKDGHVEVILQFLLQQQYATFGEQKKKQIQNNFNYVCPHKYQNSYADHVLNSIKFYIQLVKNYIKKQKQKKYSNDRNFIRQLETLQNAVALLFSILPKGLKPKALISCLEQTQLFRTYSYLLKTLNCSLYEAIRKTGKFDQILQQIKRKQLIFKDRFNLMLQQNAIQFQYLESGIQEFIRYLISVGLVDMEISVNSNSNSADSTNKAKNQCKIGSSQVYKHGDRVYSWKILVEQKRMREFNQKILLELTEGDTTTVYSSDDGRKHQNLFHIEYMAKRNLISVWYISNIEINIQNTDALLYHCNNMMMELNNVSVEHTERQSNKSAKRKQRVLAFKVITHFNVKENPFINLMLLIDKAMIYGKVCEPEITKKTTRVQDYSRFNVVGKRINHLSNLFIKKIRRHYQNSYTKSRDV